MKLTTEIVSAWHYNLSESVATHFTKQVGNARSDLFGHTCGLLVLHYVAYL